MIYFCRRLDSLDVRNHVQPRRLSAAIRVKRNGPQILNGTNLGFRVLNCQEIVVAIARIDRQLGAIIWLEVREVMTFL